MERDASLLEQLTSRRTLLEAFGRVRGNGGCRGADGVTLDRFAANLDFEIDSLQDRLLRRCYRPFPLLRIELPKPSGGVRYLAVPTVRDRVLQTAVFLLTRDLFEREFEDCSHAFRQGRSVRSAIRQIHELREQGYRCVVDADIDAFFDSIPHDRLLSRLEKLPLEPYVRELFALWIGGEIYDGRRVVRMRKGIPQGAVTSPMLANLFLDELDENLALFDQKVVRYADDFVVLCREPAAVAEALELTDYLLEQLELDLNHHKTITTSFDQGFKFLGAIFVRDTVFLPLDVTKPDETQPPYLPPPLDLLTYLELRQPE